MSPALKSARERLEGYCHDIMNLAVDESALKPTVVQRVDETVHRLVADVIAAVRSEWPEDRAPF